MRPEVGFLKDLCSSPMARLTEGGKGKESASKVY